MKTSHTPGPWKMMQVNSTFKIGTEAMERFVKENSYLAGDPFVCEINDDFTLSGWRQSGLPYSPIRNAERVLANANLVAAAPELLFALETMVEEAGKRCGWDLNRARAAISKARGIASPPTP